MSEDIDAGGYAAIIGWLEGGELTKAQRRKARQTQIEVDYSLRWQGDRLRVTLENNRATDRNYVVYVVVEETLFSGQVLHTFEGIPVTGQLTYVPQSYFDEEMAALAAMAAFLRDFAKRYSESLGPIDRPPGPGDPDPGWLLGVDRHILAADPVMRALESNASATTQDIAKLIGIAMRHPPAAAVLAQLLDDDQRSTGHRSIPGTAA
ncbi:MAG: hypothetical protein EON59_03545 [Alphaproteobacteria bacterium]|nr:MAG: hypothetical protein EON59_03545 [Alphaproteobacteria bacterium]